MFQEMNRNMGRYASAISRSSAEQGGLLEHDWVWKLGLTSWVAASEVPGLFADSVRLRRDRQRVNRSAGGKAEKLAPKPDFKKRAKEQIKSFVLMSLYLWVVFGMLALHELIILSQHQINYVSHGLAIVNALIFAKVMLVADDLHWVTGPIISRLSIRSLSNPFCLPSH